MSQELIFELNNVRVTPYIAQFGSTSYQIASISSVRARQGKGLSRLAILLFLLGVGIFVAAILRSGTPEQADANFPVGMAGVGTVFLSLLVQFFAPRRIYKLVLRTHGGDVEVLTSSRSQFILDVKKAIEDAFVAHTQRSSSDH
jgi:hypothetical protein